MKNTHFVRAGWFYLHASVFAAVLCLLALAFCVNVFLAADRHSHSASDTLYGVYPYFLTTFLLLDWVAHRLSEKQPVKLHGPELGPISYCSLKFCQRPGGKPRGWSP